MFKAEVLGHIGADVEIKESNGSKFAVIRVAHSERFEGNDGQRREETTWIDVTISNVDSKVIPYLKQGVQVFVRGNARLRCYSSPKLKKMLAGLTISASEIELCGGVRDDVPRQLINPDTSELVDVTKYYWVGLDTKGMKKDDMKLLIDSRGRQYGMNSVGFVAPVPEQDQPADSSQG